jgi:hypothetical protein
MNERNFKIARHIEQYLAERQARERGVRPAAITKVQAELARRRWRAAKARSMSGRANPN